MNRGLMVLVLVGSVLFSACSVKKQPLPTVEQNVTVETNSTTVEERDVVPSQIEIGERLDIEPEKGDFDWQQNDEVIQDGIVDRVIVVKSKRVLVLFNKEGGVLSRHRISLGEHPEGIKLQQGDKKTPEGIYTIVDKRSDPKYYKEMLISYPNADDRERAKEMGVNPGGGITIHAQVPWNWGGSGDDHTLAHDWTNGCMAMTNKGMDSVWEKIPLGTIIEIRE